VLIVDDDMRNAFALNKYLKSKGMNVNIANSGIKALDVLNSGDIPDIILMDIMMPEMDGFETMRRIRAVDNLKHIPILALTAKAMESDREECLKSGANDYVSKPIDIQKLLSLLRIWLY
jgi:CheY-like chemotaxis protein